MFDYLEEILFRDLEANRLNFLGIKGYRELDRQILARVGEEDPLMEWLSKQANMENLACFRHGFRLAVQLLLLS